MPPDDADFSTRWRLIKSGFSRALPRTERLSDVRKAAGERGIWQRHYWEHPFRVEGRYQQHLDCVHVSLLKHGLGSRLPDWSHSTFHDYVCRGIYPADGCEDASGVVAGEA
ncbi:hypothetical protein [Methylotetracoccus oryzae]|uniref:hypothetical protein n=1 Tax=Methylotetracoccus oryzae TaxID=1919059 RepID=UPI0038B3C96E